MLARLSSLPGVLVARVDVTGRTFALSLAPAADRTAVPDEALQILGPKSLMLEREWVALETADAGHAALWLDGLSIRQLSLLEARILAGRWGAAAARQAGLGRAATDRILMVLRFEFAAEFERVHDRGGTSDRQWFKKQFPAAVRRAVDRLRPELDAAAVAAVLAGLEESIKE